MLFRLAADLVLAVHLLFLVFVTLGGLLVFHRSYWSFVHLPAVAWGAWAELTGKLCPLTLLENHLLRQAGEAGYPGSFIDHYLLAIIYPEGLTPDLQILLGSCLLVWNGLVYGGFLYRRRRGPPCA